MVVARITGPCVPGLPGVPGAPAIPGVLEVPGVPGVPGVLGVPPAPGVLLGVPCVQGHRLVPQGEAGGGPASWVHGVREGKQQNRQKWFPIPSFQGLAG